MAVLDGTGLDIDVMETTLKKIAIVALIIALISIITSLLFNIPHH